MRMNCWQLSLIPPNNISVLMNFENKGGIINKVTPIIILLISFYIYISSNPDDSIPEKFVYMECFERYYNSSLETGLLDTAAQFTYITKYDSSGNELEQAHKNEKGEVSFIRRKSYFYYPNGRIKKIITKINSGQMIFSQKFFYDSKGIKIQENWTTITKKKGHEEKEFRSTKFKYINGRLSEELELPLNNVYKYSYDVRGYLIKKLTYFSNNLDLIEEYKYDSSGNRISDRCTDDGNAFTHTWFFKYDSLNRKIETSVVDGKGKQDGKWTYEFDTNDRIIETTERDFNKPGAITKFTYIQKRPFKNKVTIDNAIF